MLEEIRKCWIVLFLNHFIIYTDVLDTYTNITIKWFSYNWLEWYEKRPSYENITGIIWGSYSFVITRMYKWHDIIILRLFEWSLYDSLSQSNYHLFKPYNSDFYMNQFLDIIMWCKYYLICKTIHVYIIYGCAGIDFDCLFTEFNFKSSSLCIIYYKCHFETYLLNIITGE